MDTRTLLVKHGGGGGGGRKKAGGWRRLEVEGFSVLIDPHVFRCGLRDGC